MKEKLADRAYIRTVLLGVLVTFASGCGNSASHRLLNIFFTGVPSVGEEKTVKEKKEEVARKNKIKDIPVVKKSPAPKPKWYSHAPYATGQCDRCHQVSAGLRTFGSRGSTDILKTRGVLPGKLRAPPQKLCMTCHTFMSDSITAVEGLWLHAPAAQGNCSLCHDPHQSVRPHLLIKTPGEICIQCHQGEFVRHPAADRLSGVCLACHNPHLGKTALMLRKDYQETKSPTNASPPETVAAPPVSMRTPITASTNG